MRVRSHRIQTASANRGRLTRFASGPRRSRLDRLPMFAVSGLEGVPMSESERLITSCTLAGWRSRASGPGRKARKEASQPSRAARPPVRLFFLFPDQRCAGRAAARARLEIHRPASDKHLQPTVGGQRMALSQYFRSKDAEKPAPTAPTSCSQIAGLAAEIRTLTARIDDFERAFRALDAFRIALEAKTGSRFTSAGAAKLPEDAPEPHPQSAMSAAATWAQQANF